MPFAVPEKAAGTEAEMAAGERGEDPAADVEIDPRRCGIPPRRFRNAEQSCDNHPPSFGKGIRPVIEYLPGVP
jgi:hypothetical protein